VDFFNPATSPVFNPGTNVTIACPDDSMPVFQQRGSVVPLADLHDPALLRLRAVAPQRRGAVATVAARVYDDDGITTRYQAPLSEAFVAAASVALARISEEDAAAPAASVSAPLPLTLRLTVEQASWNPMWQRVQWEVALPGRSTLPLSLRSLSPRVACTWSERATAPRTVPVSLAEGSISSTWGAWGSARGLLVLTHDIVPSLLAPGAVFECLVE
jgi:hypothetical protein